MNFFLNAPFFMNRFTFFTAAFFITFFTCFLASFFAAFFRAFFATFFAFIPFFFFFITFLSFARRLPRLFLGTFFLNLASFALSPMNFFFERAFLHESIHLLHSCFLHDLLHLFFGFFFCGFLQRFLRYFFRFYTFLCLLYYCLELCEKTPSLIFGNLFP